MTARLTETRVVASLERLTVRRLRAFVEAGVVAPAEQAGETGSERVFEEADLARLELLCELAEDFDLDDDALALVMSLIDQLHGLRHEMRSLLRAIEAEPPKVRGRIGAAFLNIRGG